MKIKLKRFLFVLLAVLFISLIIFGIVFSCINHRREVVASADTTPSYTTHFESADFNYTNGFFRYSFSFIPQSGTDPHCLFIGIENIDTSYPYVFVFDLRSLYSSYPDAMFECYAGGWVNVVKGNLKDYDGQYYRSIRGKSSIYLYVDGNFLTVQRFFINVYAYSGTEYLPFYVQGLSTGYDKGYQDGLNKQISDTLTNPVNYFLEPVHQFLNTKLFGTFSLGDAFNVVLFVCVAVIFIKMFAGG